MILIQNATGDDVLKFMSAVILTIGVLSWIIYLAGVEWEWK